MSSKSSTAQQLAASLRLEDADLHPDAEVVTYLQHATEPVRGKVQKLSKRSVTVQLSHDAIDRSGKVLYPANTTLTLPRITRTANEAPPEGYVRPANTITAPPVTAISPVLLETIEASRARLAALAAEVKSLSKQLSESEAQVFAALASGIGAPPHWAVAIEKATSTRVVPSWKAEAIKLAVQAGLDPDAYEKGVQAATPPSISTKEILVLQRLP